MTGIERDAPAGAIRLAAGIRLRRERFGGLAFDPRTGTTVELDRGAFCLLELAAGGTGVLEAWKVIEAEKLERKGGRRQLVPIIRDLLTLGLVTAIEATDVRPSGTAPRERGSWPSGPPLSAPEAVHWAITYRCRAECPDCYAARHRNGPAPIAELSAHDAVRLVDRVAAWGAFQLAIGGGEPFLHQDLPLVTRRAHDLGLAVHVTTGGGFEPTAHIDRVLESLTCLQIGIRHEALLGTSRGRQGANLPELRRRAEAHGVVAGANLVLCRAVVQRFEEAVERLVDLGFKRLTILRYKPPSSPARWAAESPDPSELLGLETRIARLLERLLDVDLRLDCALAFLERHLPSERARRSGLRGCVAASRIVAVGPDGSVYPCSQLIAPRFRAGSILETDPAELWTGARALKRVRYRRLEREFRQTLCGACLAMERCGGCPALSPSGLGADPGCPEPLLGPPRSLGRDGRFADLQRYLDRHRTITVAQYTERYGVGEKRALAELKRTPGLRPVPTDDSSTLPRRSKGPRRTPRRFDVPDEVGEIQALIGFTSGGFPYANREQIAGWIENDRPHKSYPEWLREPLDGTPYENCKRPLTRRPLKRKATKNRGR
jgi:radical SAM protein with 4Fe4S-binding SPASM domain